MNTLRKPLPCNNKKPFIVTTSSQVELDVDCETGWNKVVNVENHPSIIPTVYLVEPLDDNLRQVGHKVKITRNLRSGHVYTGTYTMIKVDSTNRECQFYSDDLGPSNAICSTTWQISPTRENNPKRCVLMISIAVVPDSMLIYAGRLVFVPLIKRLTKKTIKEDLKDFATHCSSEVVAVKRDDDTALFLGERVVYQDQTSSATDKAFKSEDSMSKTEDSMSKTEHTSKTEHSSSHDENHPIVVTACCFSPVVQEGKKSDDDKKTNKFITRPSDDPRLIAKEVHNVTIGRKLRDAWFNSSQ